MPVLVPVCCTKRLANVSPPEETVKVPVLVKAVARVVPTLPLVLSVRLGVAVVIPLKLPEPELNDKAVVAVSVPVVWDIVPEPFALNVVVGAFILNAPTVIAPLLAVVLSDIEPPEAAAVRLVPTIKGPSV